MQVFHYPEALPDTHKGAVFAIGNFDGVHMGHRMLLELARKRALSMGRKFGVLTFEPHPRSLFQPEAASFRITPERVKVPCLAKSLVDFTVVIPFTPDVAGLSADQFMETYLCDYLGTENLIVGRDFHFGHNRAGNYETLKNAGFHMTIIDKIGDDEGYAFSSTRIREAIRKGDFKEAKQILGWSWEIDGEVIHGDKRGRELGYPTANVELSDTIPPPFGVYACLVRIQEEGPDAPWMKAAVNIGIRPMFELKHPLVEAYIFDFDREIYGQTLRIRPIQKIRNEMKFDSLDELITQINLDCNAIQGILKDL